jgi:serine/threonine protein kinase
VALKFLDGRGRYRDLIGAEIRVLRALSGLRHPNIIRLIDVHASAQNLVLIMERADCNLADLRQASMEDAGTNLSPDLALRLVSQAAEALDFLAGLSLPALGSRGLQHCDIKPSNLLLLGDTLKVADFGLCAGTGWQTHQGKGWRGTWPYAAPELYDGRPAAGTDQYALAVTFCEMVWGERAFWPGAKPTDAPTSQPVNLSRVREREMLVLTRALHPQSSLRYPTCRAFVDALRRAITRPSRQMRRVGV